MFKSPDALRHFTLALASQMRVEGNMKQSRILEHRANLVCTTGWEWLGELGAGIEHIRELGKQSNDIEEKLDLILETTKSTNPYGALIDENT